MSQRLVRRAVAVTAALALLPLAPAQAAAQRSPQAITAAELRAHGTGDLYEAVAALRPDWLQLAGDASNAEQAEQLLVFVDGRHVGNVLALRGLQASSVRSVRLRGQEFVRATIPRYPRTQFTAALFVATLGRREAPAAGRVTLSLDGGASPISVPMLVRRRLADQGYHVDTAPTGQGYVLLEDPGSDIPVSVLGATLHYTLRGGWGVALTGQRTLEGWARGFSPTELRVINAQLGSTEGAILLSRQLAWMQVGVGPAVRRLDWLWSRGSCGCADKESFSNTALGATADARFLLPVASRLMPHIRIHARYYGRQETSYSLLDEPVDAGGLVVTLSGGISGHF